ncbi:hypothetical protein [Sphingomonas abietis]|uniref:Uncharacterized protein n=1 Tax=Sphingomonas abietis TaxID=3012344 RepID=A0ABY7NHV2_9SPHN|nr:hypothetical protein [Sphingomonas abietis]WBO21115.1 hypothetical protein PBT88_12995 [Sphingomonas abietis]
MIRPLAAALILVALVGPADARPLKPEQEAKIQPAGKAVNCISAHSIRETRVRDDRTIDFYMAGGKVYRNRLPNSCPELGFEERFGYETSIDQLCNVDIIHVLHDGPSAGGAACGLSPFQPISGAPR